MEPYSALCAPEIGLLVLGEPSEIQHLLDQARELNLERFGVLTDDGVFAVATEVDWLVCAVKRPDLPDEPDAPDV